jgi:hypothetical protein
MMMFETITGEARRAIFDQLLKFKAKQNPQAKEWKLKTQSSTSLDEGNNQRGFSHIDHRTKSIISTVEYTSGTTLYVY